MSIDDFRDSDFGNLAQSRTPHPDGAPDREGAWQVGIGLVFVIGSILLIALGSTVQL